MLIVTKIVFEALSITVAVAVWSVLWNTPTEVWQIKVINKVRPVTARETQHQSQATPNLSSIAVQS